MIRIIPNKNNIGAEIDTDLQKLSKENFKIIINFIILTCFYFQILKI